MSNALYNVRELFFNVNTPHHMHGSQLQNYWLSTLDWNERINFSVHNTNS